MTRKLLGFLCISLCLVIAGCGKESSDKADTIKIGAALEQTGQRSDIAIPVKNAVTMAIKEINGQGGIIRQGKKYLVELVVEDTHSTPEGAVEAVKKLIKQDDVLAIIGPNFSKEVILASYLAEDAKIVLITPGATAPEITVDHRTGKPKEYVFRTGFSDSFQAAVLAKFARENRRYKTAAVLYDASAKAPTGQALLFKNSFEEMGGKVVALESFQGTDQSFTDQLNRIKNAKPDVVFLPVFYTHLPLIAQQIKQAGIQADILGTDAWNNPNQEFADNPFLEGAFFIAHYSINDPSTETQLFTSKYKEFYKKTPDDVAALSYDTCLILFKALENTPKLDRKMLRDTLVSLPPEKGVTGNIDYSELFGGEPLKNAVILQIKNGKPVWVGYESP